MSTSLKRTSMQFIKPSTFNATEFLLSNNFSFVPSLPLAFAFESEEKEEEDVDDDPDEIETEVDIGDVVDLALESGSASSKIFASGEFGGRLRINSWK